MNWIVMSYELTSDNTIANVAQMVFGPFQTIQSAEEYADEFGGAWEGYSVIELQKPKF